MPMVNYINGMGLRRIVLQGDGTKKNPYKFIIPPLSLLTS